MELELLTGTGTTTARRLPSPVGRARRARRAVLCLDMRGENRGNRAPCARRTICASRTTRGVYLYCRGRRSCATRLTALRSARLRPRFSPHMHLWSNSSLVRRFGFAPTRRSGSSRALHPRGAARYVVAGIPAPRLACVSRRSARTVAVPLVQLTTHLLSPLLTRPRISLLRTVYARRSS